MSTRNNKIRTQIARQVENNLPLAEIGLDLNYQTEQEQQFAQTVLARMLQNRCIHIIHGVPTFNSIAA